MEKTVAAETYTVEILKFFLQYEHTYQGYFVFVYKSSSGKGFFSSPPGPD